MSPTSTGDGMLQQSQGVIDMKKLLAIGVGAAMLLSFTPPVEALSSKCLVNLLRR